MSGAARKSTTVGEIVNLMAVDAQNIQEAFNTHFMIYKVITSPVRIHDLYLLIIICM